MIWNTGQIICNVIHTNKIIDGGPNKNEYIDFSDILYSNDSLGVVNKITFEWRQSIRKSYI